MRSTPAMCQIMAFGLLPSFVASVRHRLLVASMPLGNPVCRTRRCPSTLGTGFRVGKRVCVSGRRADLVPAMWTSGRVGGRLHRSCRLANFVSILYTRRSIDQRLRVSGILADRLFLLLRSSHHIGSRR